METVVSNLIVNLQALEHKVNALDNALGMYFKYKNEETGFQKYVNEQLEEMKGNEGNK